MTDYECGYETFPRTMVSPAEYCEAPVDLEGEFCVLHDEDQGTDWDQLRRDALEEQRWGCG